MDAAVYTPSVVSSTPQTSLLPPMPVTQTITSDTTQAVRVHTPAESSANMRLLGAEALFSLHDYLNKPTSSYTEKDSLGKYKGDLSDMTPSKMPLGFPDTIAIDIDSDSESFGNLQFEDYDNDKSKVFDNMEDKGGDCKGVIIIDDNTDFLGPSGNDPSLSLGAGELDFNFDTNTERSSGTTRRCGFGIGRKNLKAMVEEDKDPIEMHTQKFQRSFRASLKKPKLFDCEKCGREFTNIGLLEAHLVGAHGVTETTNLGKITHFQCQFCKKKFRYQATLDKHVIRHNNNGANRPYRCSICRNGYRYQESLNIHLKVHREAISFECDICDKTYSSKILFQKHIVYMHEVRRTSKSQQMLLHDSPD